MKILFSPFIWFDRRNIFNVTLKLGDKQGAIADVRQAAKLYRIQAKNTDLQDTLERLRKLGATE